VDVSTQHRDQRQEERDPAAFESGVVPRGLVFDEAPEETPPWDVVHAYLTRGEHRFWVEAHAARSVAFADVLAALRQDCAEVQEEASRGVVVPLRRAR
jgi:hypothetical protein